MKFHMGPFFQGFVIAMGLLLFIVGAVNFLVDPYFYREQRIRYFNYLPIITIGDIAPVKNVFRLYSKGPNVKFSIIGTSHILWGITDCNYPEMEKMAVSAMTLKESTEILQQILVKAKVRKTVFVELCGVKALSAIRDHDFLTRTLSLRTTVYSLRVIRNNLFNHQTIRNTLCMPYFPYSSNVKSLAGLESSSTDLRPVKAEEIAAIKKMYAINDQLKNNLQHEVVFFTAPLPSEIMEKEKYKQMNREISSQMAKTMTAMQSSNAQIKFRFINLVGTEIGKEYQFRKGNFFEGWYDGTHFKSRVGDQMVKYLIDHSN